MNGLDGLLIGVSISEPSPAELAERGLSWMHVTQVFTETARHLLAAGAGVAYGGRIDYDLGPIYTTILLNLVTAYRSDLRPGPDKVTLYMAEPHWNAASEEARQALTAFCARYTNSFTVVPCPAGPAGDPAGAYTAMRKTMTEDCQARIVLGGKVAGHVGRYPGVLEEALLSVRAGRPLFVVGGFGGAAGALARHLAGERVGLLSAIDGLPVPAAGEWAELRNGLDADDNRRLAETSDVDEIVALVIRGLRRL